MRELDERVITIRQKISSKAFGYALIALWGMISYRMFILHQTTSEYADILLLALGLSVYILINTISSGVYGSSTKKLNNKFIGLILEFIFLIGFIVAFNLLIGIESLTKSIYTTLIIIIIRFSPYLFNKLSDWIINKKIEND